MALCTASPVFRSQMMVVSRWLVMPMASMSEDLTPAAAIASLMTPDWLDQMPFGSCSTQPGSGKNWSNSFCASPAIWPSWSKTMARELVVPWSSAMT